MGIGYWVDNGTFVDSYGGTYMGEWYRHVNNTIYAAAIPKDAWAICPAAI